MNIKLWRVLLFVLIIIGTTVLIYPFPRDMVPLYLKSGKISKASDLISQLLEEDPDDLELLTISADVYLVRGLPDKAIASLKAVLKHDPNDIAVLEKLVQAYEWNVMPQEAVRTWELLSKLQPTRIKPLEKLVMYYRYFDALSQEVEAIIRLNNLQARKPFSGDFLSVLNEEVQSLSEGYEQNSSDPYLNFLIQRIFIVGEQFKQAFADGAKVDPLQYVLYALEYFVAVDRVEDGYEYAARMDEQAGLDVESRLQLVKVITWSGNYGEALEVAQRLQKLSPDNIKVLTEIAWLSRRIGNFEVAEVALEKLVNLEPDNEEHQETLGNVYLETGKFDKAVNLFRRLADKFDNWIRYAHDMLRAALFSSDKKLMAEVVEDTEEVDVDSPDYLRTRGELLLTLERPLEAYQVLKRVTEGPEATIADFERLIDAAGATADNLLVAETIELALKFRPGDTVLMRKAGEAWLNAGEPLKSYRLYREVVGREGIQDDIIQMLIAASETQDLELARDAAGYAVKIAPEDVKVYVQAGDIMLWLNSPVDSYPYYKKAALLTGGAREYVMKLVQVASFTADKKIFRDAAETAMSLRPDDEQVALLAAAVWAAAGDSIKAQDLISRFAGRSAENMEMLLQWAEFADRSGLSEEAYRIYDELYSLNYKKKQVRKNLARLAGWTNRPDVAAKLYGEMSDESPQKLALAMEAGKAYSDASDYINAVKYFERSFSLNPADLDLKMQLARTYGFADMNAKRIKLFKELYEAGHLPETERIELARAYLGERKPIPALEILEPYNRLKKLPRQEGFLLATALQQAGRRSEASAVYKKLGKEYIRDDKFLARLGAEALFNGFQSEAYDLFSAALKVDSENHTALKGLGIILGEREQYKRAISTYRKYLSFVPDDAEARYQLGEIYRTMGREGNAVREFKRAARIILKEGKDDVSKRDVNLINR